MVDKVFEYLIYKKALHAQTCSIVYVLLHGRNNSILSE